MHQHALTDSAPLMDRRDLSPFACGLSQHGRRFSKFERGVKK